MRAQRSALFGAFTASLLLFGSPGAVPPGVGQAGPPEGPRTTPEYLPRSSSWSADAKPAAVVAWPVSRGLLVAEVVTSGASASDEYIEIVNASEEPLDLDGLEIVYASATGSTVTRRAAWTSPTTLGAGDRLLLANANGRFAAGADIQYAEGLSATGGAIAIRATGGDPVDAVGWGAAAGPYVEGSPAPAPPAGSSIERRTAGRPNALDTNDNAADWQVNAVPVPEARGSTEPTPSPTGLPEPSPEPTASPSPALTLPPATPDPTPTSSPDPMPTSVPEPSASPAPTSVPTPAATPSPSPTPTPAPTPTPMATASPGPTPSPMPNQTVTPSPEPSSPGLPISVANARTRPAGTPVRIQAVVTGEPGRVGVDELVAVSDAGGAVFVRLPAGLAPPRGARIDVQGRIAAPYGQVEVRATTESLGIVGDDGVPVALPVAALALGESTEARLVTVEATVAARPTREASGDILVRMRDTGGTEFRARATARSGIEPGTFAVGEQVRLTGVVGQRASRSGAADGYRLWIRDHGDVVRIAAPAPPPSPGPSASPPPTPSPRATPGRSPQPTPSGTARGASPTPGRVSIATAIVVGGTVAVAGTVTVEATLLDATGRRTVIADETGAIEVFLPAATAVPSIGARLVVSGFVGSAYGAPRLSAVTVEQIGQGSLPSPRAVTGPIPASLVWQLIRANGTVTSRQRTGDRWRAEIDVGGTIVAVAGLAGAGIPAERVEKGSRIEVTGIARRPSPAASDQRLVITPRSASDLRVLATAGGVAPAGPGASTRPGVTGRDAGSTAGGAPSPDPGTAAGMAGPRRVDLADLAGMAASAGGALPGDDPANPGPPAHVEVSGLVLAVTAGSLTIDDGTARGRVLLEAGAAPYLPLIETGDAIAATGFLRTDQLGTAVVVTTATGLVRLGDLGEALPIGTPDAGEAIAASVAPGAGSPGTRAAATAARRIGVGEHGSSAPDPAGLAVGAVAAGLAFAVVGGSVLVRRRRRRLRASSEQASQAPSTPPDRLCA